MHKHKCPDCGHHIWEHGEDHADREAFRAAHTCKCGTYQTWKHDGPDDAPADTDATVGPVALIIRDFIRMMDNY